MHKIEITTTHGPFSKISVDGHDISNLVLDYSVSQKAAEIPVVTLHLDGTDMVLTERCAFRFPKPVREFLERLQKGSTASTGIETADNQIISEDGPQDSY